MNDKNKMSKASFSFWLAIAVYLDVTNIKFVGWVFMAVVWVTFWIKGYGSTFRVDRRLLKSASFLVEGAVPFYPGCIIYVVQRYLGNKSMMKDIEEENKQETLHSRPGQYMVN